MKFLRFASLLRIVTMVLLVAGPNMAGAAEDDLPPPAGVEEEIPLNPDAQADLTEQEDSTLPDPSLGEDALPDPMGSGSGENIVNPEPANDSIYLPSPTAEGPVNTTPVGQPYNGASSRVNYEGSDWRYGWNKRPIFTLHGGMGMVNYLSEAVPDSKAATTVGASVRLFDLGQTVFLHAYGSYSWVNVGTVGPFPDTKDSIIHFGPMLEIGIGRRVSLFGSLLRRSHTLRSDPQQPLQDGRDYGNVENYTTLVSDGWKPGIGGQYDFYVIPHGSLGVRAHLEMDMAVVVLTMSLEPVPRKRFSLNFDEGL